MTADQTIDVARVPPSLSDQVALVDAVKVATLICARGQRSAIQASTVDIIAMAQRLLRLQSIADLTYELLAATDELPPPGDTEGLAAVKRLVSQKISVIGASLEALGYGQPESTAKENNDGQG